MRTQTTGSLILVLFLFSGVAGLIYQSVWTHYLGLLLGHAAYAQTLVLIMFMGGMALGAWLAGRLSHRLSNLVLAYAIAEAIIGVCGLIFHSVFVEYAEFTRLSVLPLLGAGALADIYQWSTAALLILPQCVLLGATFPLLSAGYLRLTPNDDTRVLGGLYFTNSFGAGFGALLATFMLLPAVGMPGAILTAGLINVFVAIVAWALSKTVPADPSRAGEAPSNEAPPLAHAEATAVMDRQQLTRVLITVTALSGAFSFIYEIGWIRLLNQVLGTTVHSFELMLAAFIFGLAFGGLWVRRRIHLTNSAIKMAAYAQVAMGIAAMFSVVVFSQSYDWVAWVMHALASTEGGYTIFSISSAIVALLVMFPAAFFAGMTLPLFTAELLRSGAGEQSIGRIYAGNTLGSIVGVVIAVHVLIPTVGVRLGVFAAAAGDFVLGVYLLRRFRLLGESRNPYWLASLVGIVVLAVALGNSRIDPAQQISGVFRYGMATLGDDVDVHYLKDGKTATVSVMTHKATGTGSIATNGKTDAGLALDLSMDPALDEETMILAGALPLAVHPEAKRIGVIGWGSGLTAQTLLGSQVPEVVETVEIEKAMYEGARLFGDRVKRAYDDPRSVLVVEDARKHFATSAEPYDVIISEPSNPWVSGVSQLFTQEFYTFLNQHLDPDNGLLVQWVHTYELSDALVAQMVHALLTQFPYVEVYLASSADLIMLASHTKLKAPDFSPLRTGQLQPELERIGFISEKDFAARWIGNEEILWSMVNAIGALPYSDYFPTVALEAPRQRYMKTNANWLLHLAVSSLNVRNVLMDWQLDAAPEDLAHNAHPPTNVATHDSAWRVYRALASGDALTDEVRGAAFEAIIRLRELGSNPVSNDDLALWGESLAIVVDEMFGQIPPQNLADVFQAPNWLSDNQSGVIAAVMQALVDAAQQDPDAMSDSASAALAYHESLPKVLNEQLLVFAMTGAAAQRDFDRVRQLEDDYGLPEISNANYNLARQLLLVWADSSPQ